jgi:hypothetical protein
LYNKSCSPVFNYVTIYDMPGNFREFNLLAGERAVAVLQAFLYLLRKQTFPHKRGFLFVDYKQSTDAPVHICLIYLHVHICFQESSKMD